jgi:hypothetical protein
VSGVPKFADAILTEAAIALVAGAVDAIAEAARERRERAEADAREQSRLRIEQIEQIRDEALARAGTAGRERELEALARRERVRALLDSLGSPADAPSATDAPHLDALLERERALGDLDARLAGLEADALVMRWCAGEVAEARADLARLRAADGDLVPQCGDLASLLRDLPQRARAAQEAEERRRYIARGIAEAMRGMGFTVSEPQLEHPGVGASALVFEGVRASGGEVAVSVPVEGQVWYAVDGYPLRLEAASGGGDASTCDEAEREISAMHAVLADRFGVRMGTLDWEGRDPSRVARYADDLPDSHGTLRGVGGGA